MINGWLENIYKWIVISIFDFTSNFISVRVTCTFSEVTLVIPRIRTERTLIRVGLVCKGNLESSHSTALQWCSIGDCIAMKSSLT